MRIIFEGVLYSKFYGNVYKDRVFDDMFKTHDLVHDLFCFFNVFWPLAFLKC